MAAEGGESGAEKGRGPRIYVGGIPTAVSETMVRNHFSQWGTVLDVVSMRHSHLHIMYREPHLDCRRTCLPSHTCHWKAHVYSSDVLKRHRF